MAYSNIIKSLVNFIASPTSSHREIRYWSHTGDGLLVLDFLSALLIMTILIGLFMQIHNVYKTRARLAEPLFLSHEARVDLMEYYAAHGHWPDAVNIEIPESPVITERISKKEGSLSFHFITDASPLSENSLSIRSAQLPNQPLSPIVWLCGYKEGLQDHVVNGINETDIKREFLPYICRNNVPAVRTSTMEGSG